MMRHPLPVGIVARRATPDDARTIQQTLGPAFEAYREFAPPGWSPPWRDEEGLRGLAAALARDDTWCLLAFAGDVPVGHVALADRTTVDRAPPPPGTLHIWQIFVRPRWQGTGLASALLDAAVAEARTRGAERLQLWTPSGAARARAFYEREGWKATGAERLHDVGLPLTQYAIELDSGHVGGAAGEQSV